MALIRQNPFKLAVVIALLCSAATFGGEIVKWVDEEGKVHYGDRVPQKYKEQAEVVDAEAPMLGLSKEEITAQQRATAEYERQVEIQRRIDSQKKEQQPAFQHNPASSPKNTMTREDCRNAHRSKTADRVRCFKAVEASESANQ